ncbi:hypothetical protein EJB05_34360, partial [Eragrostis curvula]
MTVPFPGTKKRRRHEMRVQNLTLTKTPTFHRVRALPTRSSGTTPALSASSIACIPAASSGVHPWQPPQGPMFLTQDAPYNRVASFRMHQRSCQVSLGLFLMCGGSGSDDGKAISLRS